MIDQTRDMALMMQKGIRDCRTRHFGPLSFGVLEFPAGKSYMACLVFFGIGLNLSIWTKAGKAPPGLPVK